MNCKPGDLAEVVGKTETPGLKGMFVIVESLVIPGSRVDGLLMGDSAPAWVCRSAVTGSLLPALIDHEILGRYCGSTLEHVERRPIADVILRPIRDQLGEDETLTWAPVPATKQPVAA